jgi:peptide-methionine (S)-S-oxide reductase
VIKVEFDDNIVPLEASLDALRLMIPPRWIVKVPMSVAIIAASCFITLMKIKPTVDRTITKLRDMGVSVVTEVHPSVDFYKAEEAHQDFFTKPRIRPLQLCNPASLQGTM